MKDSAEKFRSLELFVTYWYLSLQQLCFTCPNSIMSVSIATRSIKCVTRASVSRPCTPARLQKHQSPVRLTRSVVVRASDDEEDGKLLQSVASVQILAIDT